MPNISYFRLYTSGHSPAPKAGAGVGASEPPNSQTKNASSVDAAERILHPKDVLELSDAARTQPGDPSQAELSESDQQRVNDLKKRDLEVRAHEQAHVAAAGKHAKGGPSYTYETGPDGQRYAVEGEVPVDISPVSGDPEATIEKMRAIRRAAQAPADPSSADRSVAAKAAQAEAKAQQQLQETQREETEQAEEDRPIDVKAAPYVKTTDTAPTRTKNGAANSTATPTAQPSAPNPSRLHSDLITAYSRNPIRTSLLNLFA